MPITRVLLSRFGDRLTVGSTTAAPAVRPGEPRVTERAAARPDMPVLATLVFDRQDYGRAVITSPRVVIGRHSRDDIRINDVRVSRHHASLSLSDGGMFELHNQTADRAAANPIFVNGVEKERALLKDGDEVVLGGVVPLPRRRGTGIANLAGAPLRSRYCR